MGYRNPHSDAIHGVAVVPQSLGAAIANGATIVRPWEFGRYLKFHVVGGAFSATAAGTIKVQVQQISDDAWVDLTQSDGTTVVEFSTSLIADGSTLENGDAVGTVDLEFVDSETYKAVRLEVEQTVAAQTILIGAGYSIHGLRERPSGDTDELLLSSRS